MSRLLDDLSTSFKPKAFELLARLVEAGISVVVVNTLRTQQEQEDNVRRGVSWVKRSKHQDGLAIDICPHYSWVLHGPNKLAWNANEPIWQRIGEIGEKIGLKWGGRWTQKDLGHFEAS